MPISTPNRNAAPVILESLPIIPCDITQDPGLYIPYVNRLTTSIMAGEPIVVNNEVQLVRRTILAKGHGVRSEGVGVRGWQADCWVKSSLAAKIYVNDLVYWDYDLNDIAAGVGCVNNSQPTNGFQFGRAVATPGMSYVDGTGKQVACDIGWKRVRVVPLVGVGVTKYGTIPDFSNTYV